MVTKLMKAVAFFLSFFLPFVLTWSVTRTSMDTYKKFRLIIIVHHSKVGMFRKGSSSLIREQGGGQGLQALRDLITSSTNIKFQTPRRFPLLLGVGNSAIGLMVLSSRRAKVCGLFFLIEHLVYLNATWQGLQLRMDTKKTSCVTTRLNHILITTFIYQYKFHCSQREREREITLTLCTFYIATSIPTLWEDNLHDSLQLPTGRYNSPVQSKSQDCVWSWKCQQ